MNNKKVKPFLLIEGIEIRMDMVDLDGHSNYQPVLYISSSPTQEKFSIKTHEKIDIIKISLLKLLEENRLKFYNEKQVTFVYYITSEPKTLEECSEQLAKTMLGFPEVSWYHSYSDLTGYLWTTINFNGIDSDNKTHDIEKEITDKISKMRKYNKTTGETLNKTYLTLEIRAH